MFFEIMHALCCMIAASVVILLDGLGVIVS